MYIQTPKTDTRDSTQNSIQPLLVKFSFENKNITILRNSTSKWDMPETHLFRFQSNLEHMYIHTVKISKNIKFQASISNIFWDIVIKSLDHNPSLSPSWWGSWKLMVVHFGVRNPKITVKSFSKQMKVLKFWKKNFPWNSIHLPSGSYVNFLFLPKSDQSNSLLEWKLYT